MEKSCRWMYIHAKKKKYQKPFQTNGCQKHGICTLLGFVYMVRTLCFTVDAGENRWDNSAYKLTRLDLWKLWRTFHICPNELELYSLVLILCYVLITYPLLSCILVCIQVFVNSFNCKEIKTRSGTIPWIFMQTDILKRDKSWTFVIAWKHKSCC
jgi:hypothetical protein